MGKKELLLATVAVIVAVGAVQANGRRKYGVVRACMVVFG